MESVVVGTIIVLAAATLSYRVLPFREPGDRRPHFVLFPKYRIGITSSASDDALEDKLVRYGFRKKCKKGAVATFIRGSVFGDLSIKLARVDVGLTRRTGNELEVTVQGGWMVAPDTGDYWQLITELASNLESA